MKSSMQLHQLKCIIECIDYCMQRAIDESWKTFMFL